MITLYTYDELSEDAQEHVVAELKKMVVRDKVKHLDYLLERNLITPNDYAARFGSTNDDFMAGRVLAKAAAYYGTNKEAVDIEVRDHIQHLLYDKMGVAYVVTEISYKTECPACGFFINGLMGR